MILFKSPKKKAEDLEAFLNSAEPSWSQSIWEFIWEVSKVVIISVVIILPIRYFLVQPYYVKGASMEPNFYDKDYLIIDEISYRFREPERGEIVVFKYPQDPRQYFIKRIIALPEETIKFLDGKIYIYNREHPEGFVLSESYLSGIQTTVPTGRNSEIVLDADEFFVLGDNRPASLDSRFFGPLARKYIIGRTWLRGWPFDRAAVMKAPTYNESNQF